MVFISFDENEQEVKNLIDDYFWYKYFVKIIEDDIEGIENVYYKDNNMNKIIKLLFTFHNQIDIERVVDIHKRLLPNKILGVRINPKTGKPIEEFNERILIFKTIYMFGLDIMKDELKEVLLKHPKITVSKNKLY